MKPEARLSKRLPERPRLAVAAATGITAVTLCLGW